MSIQALIIDYDGVLIHRPALAGNFSAVAHTLGISRTTLEACLYGPNNEWWNQAKVGNLPEDAFWAKVVEALHLPADHIDWLRWNLYEDVHLQSDFVSFLESLRGHFRLALLSNALPSFSQTWERLHLPGLFEFMLNSSFVGSAKPEPRCFGMATSLLNLYPEECLFVDDQARNINAARELGFHTVLFESADQAMEDMERLLTSHLVPTPS